MIQGENKESAAASDLCYDRHKLGVDGAKVGVVRVPGYLYVVIATLPLERHAINMAEF